MATANIDLRDGTRIVIDGTPEEIARVLELYGNRSTAIVDSVPRQLVVAKGSASGSKAARRDSAPRARTGVMQHIRELIHEGFFSERRSISQVQSKLEEIGRIYPLTHLSTPLRRLVMGKELRRLREGGNWIYVSAS